MTLLSWVERAELLLVVVALALLVFAPRLERLPFVTAGVGLVGAAVAIGCGVLAGGAERFALVVAGGCVAAAMLLLHAAEMFDDRQRPEAAALVVIGGIGAVVLATGATLLELAVGVEMLSLTAAALVALGHGQRPLEAGFKYFVLTAVTFATFLFGMALVFVGTGSLALPGPGSASHGMQLVVAAGAGLMVIGLAFKLAVIPVHFGALDAYTAGPSSFVGFIMVASKLGAALALLRLATAMGASIESLLMGIGIGTIAFGVVASFAQTDLRRLLAYSAVAHAGFLALGAGSHAPDAVRFYIVAYGSAALLCFAALAGTGTGGFPITALGGARGLGRGRSLALLLGLLSLAGVPPTPGFFAKLAVLSAAFHTWGTLATAIAALGGVVGVIYYLRPMPDLLASTTTKEHDGGGLSAALWVVIVVAIGIAPALIWKLSHF